MKQPQLTITLLHRGLRFEDYAEKYMKQYHRLRFEDKEKCMKQYMFALYITVRGARTAIKRPLVFTKEPSREIGDFLSGARRRAENEVETLAKRGIWVGKRYHGPAQVKFIELSDGRWINEGLEAEWVDVTERSDER